MFPPGFTCPVVLWILLQSFIFRVRGSHPVSLTFPSHSTRILTLHDAVLTPQVLLPTVWPFPVSLAATPRISVDFFSSAYLDVSVQRVSLHMAMYSPYSDRVLPLPGFPIRKSTDRHLFAVPRSLSQLVTSFFGS